MTGRLLKLATLFSVLTLAACEVGPLEVMADPDAAAPAPDAFPGPSDEEIMAGYDDEVRSYQAAVGLPAEWAGWMIERKQAWAKAYVRGRRDHAVRVTVRYERPIAYDPPWPSETEHFAALERMAELQYPGWDFTFDAGDPGPNDVVAVLGHAGTSYADGRTIYLAWEGIFAHEFGHTIGLRHHYCAPPGDDRCPEAYPPGEEACIMNRNSASFGPTENPFLLLLTGERFDDEIDAALSDINSRYPDDYPGKRDRDVCGVIE